MQGASSALVISSHAIKGIFTRQVPITLAVSYPISQSPYTATLYRDQHNWLLINLPARHRPVVPSVNKSTLA